MPWEKHLVVSLDDEFRKLLVVCRYADEEHFKDDPFDFSGVIDTKPDANAENPWEQYVDMASKSLEIVESGRVARAHLDSEQLTEKILNKLNK